MTLEFAIRTNWLRLAAVTTLVREGFAGQLVLGTDVFLPMLTRRGGGHGYRYLFARIVPLLRRLGVADRDIEQMVTVNPRRLLTMPGVAAHDATT